MFDIERLTLGEVAAIEDLSGMAIGSLADEDKPKGKSLAAIVYVFKKRENPDFTFADALEVPMSEATALFEDDEDDEGKD